ncbi:hypothetical protein [Mesorhizobium sp. B1-1-8]|uniref:hypothetical protein n=1 Tax=Mesorhizobium sp. B1-1-8 TaxID=2589976 RepID=UPI0015E40939|nr:hypothetical protein [Mesorhizobium sp. B1-1-8]UCI09800.1 hypothetical protein FJ974_12480 [Mesorhizobium sp. B1-1-8]
MDFASVFANRQRLSATPKLLISPLEGEMAGRPERGASRQSLEAFFAALALTIAIPPPARANPLPAGFVRLADVDPTIRQNIHYASLENSRVARPAAITRWSAS